jgi:dATP pyrophosphohydrolase
MARAPFQILVYPYRHTSDDHFEYALFKRSDAGWWQGIAGGGEDNETPLEAAKRETFEEAGLSQDSEFIQLDTMTSIRATGFRDSHLWGDQVYVIPQYCFGVSFKHYPIVLSNEHNEYKWLKYVDAFELVKFDSNKTALWELDRKLNGRGPRD